MFVFLLVFIASFAVVAKDVFNGKKQSALTFFIFGLSMYTTAMSVAFTYGLKDVIPFFQVFKELLVIAVLITGVLGMKERPRFHIIDYGILAFLALTGLYAILPIGEQTLVNRLIALKSTSFYAVVYFAGRFINLKDVFVNRYLSYMVLVTIAAGLIVLYEAATNLHLQSRIGYAEYIYYFFNFEPSGSFGLSTTFESEGGYKRFAAFFANPLEHAAATLFAISAIAGLYTQDDNRFKLNSVSALALGASLASILLALSRAPLAAYGLIIYAYALLTKKRFIYNTIHAFLAVGTAYVIYLFTRFEQNNQGLVEVLVNTIDFSNPSSVGHVLEWVQGINAMARQPLGLGLGSSGRVGGTLGENVGGENQFIIIGVQAGVLALLLYLFIYIAFIRTGIKWFNRLKGKERKICITVLLMKIGIFIPLLTSEVESSSYISYMNWFLSGLFISAVMNPSLPTVQLAEYDRKTN
jgi:hypothetical protein